MKKYILVLLAICLLLCVTGISFANNKGAAIIPHFKTNDNAGYDYYTNIYISNISSQTSTVIITFYRKDRSIHTDGDDLWNGGSIQANTNLAFWDDNPAGASVTFSLNSKNTVCIKLRGLSSENFGYGLIEWSQTGTKFIRSLVACGEVVCINTGNSQESRYDITINNDEPF